MKVLILGAGFGTRLERDISADSTGSYSHLVGVPKPLLPIGNQVLVSYWTTELQTLIPLDSIYIVTNGKNHEAFVEWSKDSCPGVNLICDGALTNETRTGAVAAINFVIKTCSISDDLLVIAGDTLFSEDVKVSQLVSHFQRFKEVDLTASMAVYVTCTDEVVHKYGILETDENSRVTGFKEKPQPHETDSRKECPCFYFLNKASFPLIEEFLHEKKDLPLKERDATGHFIKYMFSRSPLYAVEVRGRFDVGGLQSYIDCHQYFLQKSTHS